MSRYTVTVKRFQPGSGKYYDTIDFKTDADFITLVAEEVRRAQQTRQLDERLIHLITGEGHPDNCPQLVLIGGSGAA